MRPRYPYLPCLLGGFPIRIIGLHPGCFRLGGLGYCRQRLRHDSRLSHIRLVRLSPGCVSFGGLRHCRQRLRYDSGLSRIRLVRLGPGCVRLGGLRYRRQGLRYARHMAGLFTVWGSYGFKSVKKIIQQAQPGNKHDSRQQCCFQFPVCCGQINSKYLAGGSCQCGSIHVFLFLDKSAQERAVANQVNQPGDPPLYLYMLFNASSEKRSLLPRATSSLWFT